jgi:hypothetical protein
MNMMRKNHFILAYISYTNTFMFHQFDFGCYKYILFDLFS